MNRWLPHRRMLLKAAVAAAAAPFAYPALPRAALAQQGPVMTAYDPNARLDIDVKEVEYRRSPSRSLIARVYAPKGDGPFPTLLDLHGGAWNNKDRKANEPMDRALAASGVLVIAVDLTLAPEAPYPASLQDANLAVRWVKARAAQWKGDASRLGVLGSSTGGHLAELLAMRPADARYNALPLDEARGVDARIAYVATRSPISDPFARYRQAEHMKRTEMMDKTKKYFVPWDAIHEANPQEILDRRERVSLPPLLIMQGSLDDNVLPALQQKFAATYRAAGGDCRLEIFEGCEHEWVAKPGPQTERAHETVKAFIHEMLMRPA